jgi:hypothetical protein
MNRAEWARFARFLLAIDALIAGLAWLARHIGV